MPPSGSIILEQTTMAVDRREFTKILLGSTGAALVSPRFLSGNLSSGSVSNQETFFQWEPTSSRTHVAIGQGGNVVVFRNGNEALISDSKNLGYGTTLRREAEALGTPLTHAVNTHHHGDHIGGNFAFSDIPLYSHRNAQGRIRSWAEQGLEQSSRRLARAIEGMREQGADSQVLSEMEALAVLLESMSPERFVPTEIVAMEREIRIGGTPVEVRHVSSGHTDNDIFLYFTEDNVLHAGDLYFNGRHPFIDVRAGATTVGWQRCIQAMLGATDGNTVVVPGHGAVSGRNGLQRQWDYFEQVRDAVENAVSQGMSRDEVTELQPESLSDIQGSPARSLGVVYDEISGR